MVFNTKFDHDWFQLYGPVVAPKTNGPAAVDAAPTLGFSSMLFCSPWLVEELFFNDVVGQLVHQTAEEARNNKKSLEYLLKHIIHY